MNWLDRTKAAFLNPCDVDLEGRTYWVPCFADLDPLVKSIARVGILNAPVVQERPDGRMIPVLGRRRLEATTRMGFTEVAARVLPEDMPEPDGFVLAFWDNYGHRGFDLASGAVVLNRLLELFPRQTVANDFLPAFGVPPKGPRIEKLASIGRLEHRVLEALASGRIQERTAALLTKCLPEDRSLVMDLVESLGLNANKNAEVIAGLFDLSIFSGRRISDVLQDHPLPDILRDEGLSAAERGLRVRDLIRSWKYPVLSGLKQEFREWHGALSLPREITVRHAQSFESEECTVEIKVRSRHDAAKVLEGLSDVTASLSNR